MLFGTLSDEDATYYKNKISDLTLCSPCILTLIFSFSTNECTFYFRNFLFTTAEPFVGCSEQKIVEIKSAFVG
jgi:hypothetical protein